MIKLKDISPDGPDNVSKKALKKENKQLLTEIYTLQRRLYAEGKQRLLIVLQGMDASGKDGLTRNLFQLASPSWTEVSSFKKPTDLEFSHDFLWRIHQQVPPAGMIGVFNRSHYEDILVPSVYGYIDDKTIKKRLKHINNFEEMLEDEGTKILKFYLHVGYDKQEEKLIERTENPEKYWKHSDGDWETREHWDKFMDVYHTIFKECNNVPWHVIPCNSNTIKLNSAAKLVLKTLQEMDPKLPSLDSEKFGK